EDDAGSGRVSVKTGEVTTKDKKRAFFARPVWQRASIVLAGVVMNFLLALIIISFLFTVQGVAMPTNAVVISEVLPHSPAQAAGLKPGDVIASIDNTKITKIDQVTSLT